MRISTNQISSDAPVKKARNPKKKLKTVKKLIKTRVP
jgi:hypothetical protein